MFLLFSSSYNVISTKLKATLKYEISYASLKVIKKQKFQELNVLVLNLLTEVIQAATSVLFKLNLILKY